METKDSAEFSAAHFDLDCIMHDPRIRSPLEVASAILTLDGGHGPYVFRFVGDARWQHRGFVFRDLRARPCLCALRAEPLGKKSAAATLRSSRSRRRTVLAELFMGREVRLTVFEFPKPPPEHSPGHKDCPACAAIEAEWNGWYVTQRRWCAMCGDYVPVDHVCVPKPERQCPGA